MSQAIIKECGMSSSHSSTTSKKEAPTTSTSSEPSSSKTVTTTSSTPSKGRYKAPFRQIIKHKFLNYHKQLNDALSKKKASNMTTLSVVVDVKEKKPSDSSKSSSIYVDKSFPANDSVLPRHVVGKVVEWKRPAEMCDNPQLFVNGVEEGDVVQGGLGDCWFVGALAILATSGNDLIEHMFVGNDMKRGEFECKFYKDGKWITVEVDDRLPCGANGRPYFASCFDANEWWVPIAEKAYAKLHGGYEAIESGTITDALKDLTGESVKILRLDEDAEFKDRSYLWKMLLHYLKESFLMGCAIEASGARVEQENEYGLLMNHAYSIIDCQEVKGNKLMRIRNPWGKGEWKGPWSDGSKEWTPALKKHFDYEFGNDGTFFMKFEDYVRFFNRIHVLCLLTDDQGEVWQKAVLQGQWKGETAGGCTNHPTWPNNPQYMITSSTADNKIFMGLTQMDLRYKHKKSPAKAGLKYEPLGIIVMLTTDPTHKKTKCDSNERIGNVTFIAQRDVSCEFVAQKDKFYVIMPSTFNPKVEQPYELMIYSQRAIKIHELQKGK